MDRVERLTNLLALLLETRQPLTMVEIFGELDGQYGGTESAMRQAFERDKASLREIGVPIETETLGGDRAGSVVYRIDRDRYDLDLDLDPDETRALQMAVAAVRPAGGAGIATGDEALWKLGGELTDAGPAVTAAVPDLPALPVLRDAAARRATVRFRYHDRERDVDPYGLLLRHGNWYVLGHDHGHGEQRTYRVDRFDSLPVVVSDDGAFERPPGFDPSTAFPADAKQFGFAEDEATGPTSAEVWISAQRASLVEREVGSDKVLHRLDDGAIVVGVPCANLNAFGSWVLGMVDHAEVLDPPEVRAAIVSRLESVATAAGAARRKRR